MMNAPYEEDKNSLHNHTGSHLNGTIRSGFKLRNKRLYLVLAMRHSIKEKVPFKSVGPTAQLTLESNCAGL